jgi:hypothetical protein
MSKQHHVIEEFGEEWRPLGERWKNHFLPQDGEEHANVAIFEGPLSWSEAIRHNM